MRSVLRAGCAVSAFLTATLGVMLITHSFENRLLPGGTYRLMMTPKWGAARVVTFTISG